jgi:4-hydroxy-3-methylbut-2-enyl diphosphate reductase
VSELAWRRVRKVTDVLQVGDKVVVTVIDVNAEKNKISLSLKDVNNNPWNKIAEKDPLDSIITGKVVRLTPFGAFVMLEDGVDGLVHISQIANKHVNKPGDELTEGQMINVMVTDIDEENHKISLSKREADLALATPEEPEISEDAEEILGSTIEDSSEETSAEPTEAISE